LKADIRSQKRHQYLILLEIETEPNYDPHSEYVVALESEGTMGQDEQWRILAEEAAQEKDPEKLAEIIEALTRALDECELQRSHASQQGAA